MNNQIYSSEELKQIQRVEYELLVEVKKVCEAHNIEYFLIGGTTLGAIRHKGFIPWDDDIDIGMTRANYEKFLKLAPLFLKDKYQLQTPNNDKNIPYFYSKIRINDTIFMEYCNRKINMHHGIYIDVFPFDIVPDDDVEYKKMFDEFQHLIRLYSLRQIPDLASKPSSLLGIIKYFIRKILHFILKIIPADFFKRKLYKVATQYNDSNNSSYCCLNFPIFKTEYIKKEDLYPLRNHKFVMDFFPIPNNYNQYLKTHYGDYMKLPEEDKQIGHKPYKIKVNDK
ncbi:LicD family protein [Thomasclavelia spiroformis DSM 1552]|uniref:LICD family protein n=1 Tax=Thomasclavelia spiroformis DSM 1552 TaxID=428126 RepID=B1C1C3_9FIRM|nr:LicD family protein [Thomasclavelia spiroformis]EDS75178.1 LICD family protein [Thomasclavelia spiroformis DSM 1552]UWO88938.1 LicD family protein [Thomasclavelia spiroformis DSM 1552]